MQVDILRGVGVVALFQNNARLVACRVLPRQNESYPNFVQVSNAATEQKKFCGRQPCIF